VSAYVTVDPYRVPGTDRYADREQGKGYLEKNLPAAVHVTYTIFGINVHSQLLLFG